MAYFTEREGDVPPQTDDHISTEFIEATRGWLEGLCERGWLARGFPRRCSDPPQQIIGTNRNAFWGEALTSLRFDSPDPDYLLGDSLPLRVLNLLEFVHRHVAYPMNADWHAHFSHHHLDFDGPRGKAEFLAEVNDLFSRFGLAYRLEQDTEGRGHVGRIVPPTLETIIVVGFHTGDTTLDEMLENSVRQFRDPNPTSHRAAVELLWDVFERLKTIEIPQDKQKNASADQLLTKAANKNEIKALLEAEFAALTGIGNGYTIRHHETYKTSIDTDLDFDWLFLRMFSVIWRVLRATGRV